MNGWTILGWIALGLAVGHAITGRWMLAASLAFLAVADFVVGRKGTL